MEILAPAGNFSILKAAIQAGCDAVYLSGKNFGARKFADNFSFEEIKEAVRYAHLRNKFIYVTINTIVFDNEWDELDEYLNLLSEIKVDAIIVQDLGVLHHVRKKFPNIIVHASTQMNIHNVEGALRLKELGVKRVVLARETPIDIVEDIVKTGIEVEVFIHGALCYSYSGQCLMSYNIGGRSGNRGECAQPCRKMYSLFEDDFQISNKCSILSMKDLCTLDNIKKLQDIGVCSVKIEGRMKSESYVTTVVSTYRNHLLNNKSDSDIKKLKLAFNREFISGYLFNTNNYEVTNINSVNHQGIIIGRVIKVNKYGIDLLLHDELISGDGIRIKGKNEIGFYANNFSKNGSIYHIDGLFNVNVNDLVYKTVSYNQNLIAKKLLTNENYNINLSIDLSIKLHTPLRIKISGQSCSIIYEKDILIETASNPLNIERIKEQLLKTDSKLIKITNTNINYDNCAFVKISEINAIRREAIEKWIQKYLESYKLSTNIDYKYNNTYNDKLNKNIVFDFVVHTKEQLDWCIENGINNIYTYFDSSYGKYERHFHTNQVNTSNSLVHNLCDYKDGAILSPSCNVTNYETLELLNQFKINGVYLSHELSKEEVKKMAMVYTKYDKGVLIYGPNLMLVSKHCFISKLKKINNIKCMACNKHRYYIIDDYHNKMPVVARCDHEPEIIIYNYKKKNEINKINEYYNNGINRFLFVLIDEKQEELNLVLKKLINKY